MTTLSQTPVATAGVGGSPFTVPSGPSDTCIPPAQMKHGRDAPALYIAPAQMKHGGACSMHSPCPDEVWEGNPQLCAYPLPRWSMGVGPLLCGFPLPRWGMGVRPTALSPERKVSTSCQLFHFCILLFFFYLLLWFKGKDSAIWLNGDYVWLSAKTIDFKHWFLKKHPQTHTHTPHTQFKM